MKIPIPDKKTGQTVNYNLTIWPEKGRILKNARKSIQFDLVTLTI